MNENYRMRIAAFILARKQYVLHTHTHTHMYIKFNLY